MNSKFGFVFLGWDGMGWDDYGVTLRPSSRTLFRERVRDILTLGKYLVGWIGIGTSHTAAQVERVERVFLYRYT